MPAPCWRPAALAPALRRVQQPVAHGFGMNWLLTPHGSETLVGHEGGTGGFSSLVLLRRPSSGPS